MPSRSENETGPRAHPAVVAVLVAAVAATLIAVVVSRPDAERRARATPVAQIASQPQVLAPTGSALVDAIPWGRVERIESASGERYALPSPAETPLVLELPEGTWLIALSHPALEEERICELTIEIDRRTDCLLELEPLTVDQYFREAGWWR